MEHAMRKEISTGLVIWALLTVPSLAQTTGQVVKIDEPAGMITIKDTSGQQVAYKPKDGLLFNAVKEGDNVSFTASEENGQKVISKLEKR
jgi:Cu/Ag efflux protein CusF